MGKHHLEMLEVKKMEIENNRDQFLMPEKTIKIKTYA
jgi:hypothetical protein